MKGWGALSGGALWALATQFAALSLMAFGGANAVVPEMHRQAVEVHHWMSGREFAALFALAQAAPGPNFMISTLVGWRVAGLAGALIATAALCAPSCLLTYVAVKAWDRRPKARWRAVVTAGLAPVSVGLIGASAWLLATAADRTAALAAATAAAAIASRANPLWWLGAAAALGAAGVLG